MRNRIGFVTDVLDSHSGNYVLRTSQCQICTPRILRQCFKGRNLLFRRGGLSRQPASLNVNATQGNPGFFSDALLSFPVGDGSSARTVVVNPGDVCSETAGCTHWGPTRSSVPPVAQAGNMKLQAKLLQFLTHDPKKNVVTSNAVIVTLRRDAEQSSRSDTTLVVKEGVFTSANGILVSFPHSEALPWVMVDPANQVAPELLRIAEQGVSSNILSMRSLVADRHTTTGDIVFICGHYDPPFPDGSSCVAIDNKAYVGRFFDKDSR